MHKKTVLHIISSLSDGGAEGTLYRLVLFDNEYKHIVVSLTDGGIYLKKLIAIDVDVYLLSMPRGKVTIYGILKLYRLIKKSHLDIIQTWMYHANLLGGLFAKFAGNNNIIWGIRGPYDKQRTSFTTKIIVRFCALFSFWLPRRIISNSYFAKNAHLAIGYCSSKMVVIDNGYSTKNKPYSDEDILSLSLKYHVKNNSPILGMVARFDSHKDHENIISALSILVDKNIEFTCLLVGSGMIESNKDLSSLISQYNVGSFVRLVGRYDDIPLMMSFLDLHVLSSAAESFPNVLAEAMLAGTPCVTTDVGDAKRIIGDTGWVVPPENAIILASQIETAICEMKNTSNWTARQEACKNRIENKYNMSNMISSYNDLWADVINAKK